MDSEPAVPAVAASEPAALSAAEQKAVAVRAYFDANSKEEKAAVVRKYPLLREIFSESNHS